MQIKTNEEKKAIFRPVQAAEILTSILRSEEEVDRAKEHFWAIGLNMNNIVQYVELVSLGTLTESLAMPRETFRLAVMKGVHSVIVGHNHPSGNVRPSSNDESVTRNMIIAGQILGIRVLDHVVISGDGRYFSFVEQMEDEWEEWKEEAKKIDKGAY